MSRKQVTELFILRTGASKEIAEKYLKENEGVLHTAIDLFRADKKEGKIK
ncbi:hypothetical protein SM021_004015 [Cronobacter muytjensii]|nr:hypothetical protein [Cronobacter muytjensii]